MRGSSGIPKSDIDLTSASTTKADTNAELQNTSEIDQRLNTSKPPLIREKDHANVQGNNAKTSNDLTAKEMSYASSSKESVSPLSAQNLNQHSAPVVFTSGKKSQVKSEAQPTENKLKEIVSSLAESLELALNKKDLNQIEIVIKGLEENNFRLDRPPISTFEVFTFFSRAGAIDVITFMKDAVTDQAAELLIRMIRLGCNVNVTDKLGNSVLMHACKAGRLSLVKVLLTECPNIRKDWLNIHGQNAAMMAYKYGNSQLYSLLERAGISRNPENPAISFYLSVLDIADDDSSDSETDEYVDLFNENNFMNLPDANGRTLLFHAVFREDVNFVSFLCDQKQFLNVALRDVKEKSVFDYINQIKDPTKKANLLKLMHAKVKQTAWLYELASYNFLDDV